MHKRFFVILLVLQALGVSAIANDNPQQVIGRILSALPVGNYKAHTTDGGPCAISANISKSGTVNFFTVSMRMNSGPKLEQAVFRSPWNGDVFSGFNENENVLSVVFGEEMTGVPFPHNGTLLKIKKNSNGSAAAVFIQNYGIGNSGTTCTLE
jgi:hypothetical protein